MIAYKCRLVAYIQRGSGKHCTKFNAPSFCNRLSW